MSDTTKRWTRMYRPLYNSGHENDEFYAYGLDGFQELLESFLAEDILVYDRSIAKPPKKVRAIMQQVTSDLINTSSIRQVICNIGNLKCGQYIESKGNFWMVASLPDNNQIYEKAILWKCKQILHFRSPLTGEIVDYPVYNYNSTQYGTGEWNKMNINIGEAQQLVFIPYNEETIEVDDRFRFLMDRNRKKPSAYRVTMVDTVAYAVGGEVNHDDDGILMWSLVETQFNEVTDSAEYMVADYYNHDHQVPENTKQDDGQIVLTDPSGKNKAAIGETKRITIVMPDTYSQQDIDVSISYGADCVQSVNYDTTFAALSIKRDRSLVGKKVTLNVSTNDGRYSSELSLQITNP